MGSGPSSAASRSRRLIPTESLAAAGPIEPNRKPRAGRLVIENDWIAHSVGKRSLTAAEREPGERGAAISRDRCAGDVDRTSVATARVVVGGDYLKRIIRIS